MNQPQYKTKFGEIVGETLTNPEAYASRVLPLLTVAEAIATKGQGANYAGQQQQGIYAQAARNKANEQLTYQREVDEEARRETARNKALERKRIELEIASAEEKAKTDASERQRLEKFRLDVESGADPSEAWKKTYPEQYGAIAAKPISRVNVTTTMKELGVSNQADAVKKIDEMNKMYPDFKFALRPEGTDPFALAGYKNELAKTANTPTREKNTQLAQDALDLIASMESHPGFSGAVGMKGVSQAFGALPEPLQGSPEASYKELEKSLISLLTTQNLGIMKGVLSETDMQIIKSASTALSSKMSEKDYKKTLGILKNKMQLAISNGANLATPNGKGQPAATAGDKYTVGKTYTDANGNSAIYRGNGQWEEVK